MVHKGSFFFKHMTQFFFGCSLFDYATPWYNIKTYSILTPRFHAASMIFFKPKLSWTITKETLAKQASKVILTIFNVQKQFRYFPVVDSFKLFDSMVLTILCYSSESWGYQYYECTERIHVNYCKRICGLNQSVSNFFLFSECVRTPLFVNYSGLEALYYNEFISFT